MRQTVFGLVAGGLLLGAIAFAIHLGVNKKSAPAPVPVVPVAPAPQVTPVPPVPPTPPQPTPPPQPEKHYSASFIRGYHDGYSGAWLAPARWVVVSEYRAGWNAGHQDRVANKPNMFRKD
jgi:hypothetical protein